MLKWTTLRKWLLFLLPTLIPGVIAGTYPGYKFYHYVWYDANFCTTCHVHDYATVGWSNSSHGETTTCHDCHHQRLRDYIREAYIMIKERPKFPEDLHHTPYVKKELCAACHVSNAADRSTITGPFKYEDVQKIPKVDRSHLHAVHMNKKTDLVLQNKRAHTESERDIKNLKPNLELDRTKGDARLITCADCHGGPQNRGHNFSATDISCIRCHSEPHETKVGKEFGCRNCHFQDFMIPNSAKKPSFENMTDQ